MVGQVFSVSHVFSLPVLMLVVWIYDNLWHAQSQVERLVACTQLIPPEIPRFSAALSTELKPDTETLTTLKGWLRSSLAVKLKESHEGCFACPMELGSMIQGWNWKLIEIVRSCDQRILGICFTVGIADGKDWNQLPDKEKPLNLIKWYFTNLIDFDIAQLKLVPHSRFREQIN